MNIFPKNESDMPDRLWETYCAEVWCCNSLNVLEHDLEHRSPFDPLWLNRIRNTSEYIEYIRRARGIIMFLLEESGRLEELELWELEHGNS